MDRSAQLSKEIELSYDQFKANLLADYIKAKTKLRKLIVKRQVLEFVIDRKYSRYLTKYESISDLDRDLFKFDIDMLEYEWEWISEEIRDEIKELWLNLMFM